MSFKFFDTLEDLQAHMESAHAKANGQIQPWQRKVNYGDYFMIRHYSNEPNMPIHYGYIPTVLEHANEDPFVRERTYVHAKFFSDENRGGEYDSIHICQFDAVLSAQQFKKLKAAHWPATPYGMMSALYAVKKQPLVFVLMKNGQPQSSQKNERQMYAILIPKGFMMVDEERLNKDFRESGWHMINDWYADDRGDGGDLVWNPSAFLSGRK